MAHAYSPDGVPVIDLSLSSWDERFVQGMRESGFVVVINHGVSTSLMFDARKATERVFSLPEELLMRKYFHGLHEETKMRSGYFPYGSEKAKDHNGGWDLKRFWQIFRKGHVIPTHFPEEIPEYEPLMRKLYFDLDTLSHRLLGALTRHSGLSCHEPFEDSVIGGDSMMRDIYYPALVDPPKDALRATPHEDINLITLLRYSPGLYIKTKSDAWIPVECDFEDALIVNTGDMFQMLSFGDFPSMTHEVRNEGMDGVRITTPLFVHPRADFPLITLDGFQHRRRLYGDAAFPEKAWNELLALGLQEKLRHATSRTTPLVTAGEYLQHRLSEIHPDA